MIRVNENEQFPVLVALLDEGTGQLVSGETVFYDIRYIDDTPLSPPVSGTLDESTVEAGIYKTVVSIPVNGSFVCYATCSGFAANTEEIIVNPENIYELTKQNRSYNISVEEVLRTNSVATASQSVRNVPLNKTDYVINRVKPNNITDWDDPAVSSGTIYAWYKSTSNNLPFRMGGPF